MMKKDLLKGKRAVTVQLKNARKLSTGSQRWLRRQLNDPYVQQAHQQGFRSRAAFKLIELDDKFHFLKKGSYVVDLGAAPGGWTQVAVQRTNPQTKEENVVGIDLVHIDPLPGAFLLQGDFLDPEVQSSFKSLLKGPVEVVLSDMAASTIGHPQTDHLRTIALAEAAFYFARQVLACGGTFIAKVFQGGADRELLLALKSHFRTVKHVKPLASRKESSEMYVLAFGFKG
jgi:23S rRNA (uridine2552-2'-O)-methyltransferase